MVPSRNITDYKMSYRCRAQAETHGADLDLLHARKRPNFGHAGNEIRAGTLPAFSDSPHDGNEVMFFLLSAQVDELLSQKEEIDKALNSTDDDLGKLRLRGMQQGVTSQLYCASGRAKVHTFRFVAK